MRNSIKYQTIRNEIISSNNTIMINRIRGFCSMNGLTHTTLLNLYNKTYQLNNEGLARFIDRLPIKWFNLLLKTI